MKKVIAPVFIEDPDNNGGNHFSLAVIDPIEQEIQYFDSQAGASSASDYTHLLKYLGGIARLERRRFDEEDWKIRPGKAPQQENGNDCGVFASAMAQKIMLMPSTRFRQNNAPYLRFWMLNSILNGKKS